jgi:hypothetical protein
MKADQEFKDHVAKIRKIYPKPFLKTNMRKSEYILQYTWLFKEQADKCLKLGEELNHQCLERLKKRFEQQ